ncbi:hypothetical protein BGZ99_000610 [Dissophora globulifera]|uniref:Cytochrome b5 heme-binding domain-containing protein n=1 Tax=Dissophora globulifera TaxID=979702 RepID=A0A9P6UYF6_9FUNG|nr:hypothetical protein BGZ99_000610 [Dissophora globulifera]
MAQTKTYTTADLAQRNTKDNLFVAIHGKVYDHPGGEEVLLEEAGRDATESFEDVGHSDEARDIMSKLYVGDFQSSESEKPKAKANSSIPKPIPQAEPTASGSLQYVLALAVVAGCVIWKVLK